MGCRPMRALLFTPFLLAAQCQFEPKDEPLPQPSPAPVVADCVRACEQLQSLGCPAGEPTPSGKLCTDWICAGGPAAHNTQCIAAAESCEAAEECAEE